MSDQIFSGVSSRVTEGIRVSVRTVYLPGESDPSAGKFVFAYLIRIENETSAAVQLLSRHWDITDSDGQKRVVDGEGVVGKKPMLLPGEFHEYVSGCDFQTPIGKMEGYYTFIRLSDNSIFEVEIPPFVMAHPMVNN